MVGRHGVAPCSRRVRAGTSLIKGCSPNSDTKAELNRRSQNSNALAGTGISCRVNGLSCLRTATRLMLPLGLAPEASAVAVRKDLLGYALEKWSSIRVYRAPYSCLEGPCGRPSACISQHLCSNEIGIPCESCTHLYGFADRCLNCSANGIKLSAGGNFRLRPPVFLASY